MVPSLSPESLFLCLTHDLLLWGWLAWCRLAGCGEEVVFIIRNKQLPCLGCWCVWPFLGLSRCLLAGRWLWLLKNEHEHRQQCYTSHCSNGDRPAIGGALSRALRLGDPWPTSLVCLPMSGLSRPAGGTSVEGGGVKGGWGSALGVSV